MHFELADQSFTVNLFFDVVRVTDLHWATRHRLGSLNQIGTLFERYFTTFVHRGRFWFEELAQGASNGLNLLRDWLERYVVCLRPLLSRAPQNTTLNLHVLCLSCWRFSFILENSTLDLTIVTWRRIIIFFLRLKAKTENRRRFLLLWRIVSVVIRWTKVRLLFGVDNRRQLLCTSIFVEINLQLLELLHLWLKIPIRHALKVRIKQSDVVFIVSGFFHRIAQPPRDLWLVRLVCISRVNKRDCTEVLRVSDHSADRLIHGATGLLAVPFTPGDHFHTWVVFTSWFVVEVMLLQDYFRVGHLRKWNTDYHHHPRRVIWKVEAFADATAANAHQDCSFLLFFVDWAIKSIDDKLVLIGVLRFSVEWFMFCDFTDSTTVKPFFIRIIHKSVGGEED